MRPLIFIPLLAIFAVPSGINLHSRDHVSPFNLFPSAPITAARDVSNEPSRVPTTTPEQPVSTPSAPRADAQIAALEAAVAALLPAIQQPSTTRAVPEPSPATTAPVQSEFAAQVEAEVLQLTNEEREKESLSTLVPNAKLRDVAVGHSADMLAHDYFDHENLQGCSSSCRATNAGYRWKSIGENIYMMSGYKLSPEKTAAKVVDGWMNSPGHRKNILGGTFTESGVGVIFDGKSVYVTALYAKPR